MCLITSALSRCFAITKDGGNATNPGQSSSCGAGWPGQDAFYQATATTPRPLLHSCLMPTTPFQPKDSSQMISPCPFPPKPHPIVGAARLGTRIYMRPPLRRLWQAKKVGEIQRGKWRRRSLTTRCTAAAPALLLVLCCNCWWNVQVLLLSQEEQRKVYDSVWHLLPVVHSPFSCFCTRRG
jgi:hypothetical protein